MGFTKLHETAIYAGPVFTLAEVTFQSPDGEEFQRQYVRHRGAVAVVPLTDDGKVILVSQYRGSIESDLLEIPAGLLDVEGESLEVAAARELREETGMEAKHLELLTTVVPAPGMTDERVAIFVAHGLREVGQDRKGPEEKYMTMVSITVTEALAMTRSGAIVDGKTIIGLHLVAGRFPVGR